MADSAKEDSNTALTCVYSHSVLFMSLGRICQLDQGSCFHWHEPEIIKKCHALEKQKLAARFRKEVLDPDDTFDKRIRMFTKSKVRGFLTEREQTIFEATPTQEPDKSTGVVDRNEF